jgi:sugar/nucleoside kinase (ribokinase family)
MSERIVVAGHICVDLTPRIRTAAAVPGHLSEVGPISVALGGSVANTGRVLAALGHDVEMCARIGDDDLGGIVTRRLAVVNSIHASITVVAGAATSYSIVIQLPGVDRSFWHHPGANVSFDGSDVDPSGAVLVHLGYPSLLPAMVTDDGRPLLAYLRRVRQSEASTSLDLAVVDPRQSSEAPDWPAVLRAAMPLVDVVSPSADDLRTALREPSLTAERCVDLLVEWGAGIAAVSDGARGIAMGTGDAARLRTGGAALSRLAPRWANIRRFQQPRRLDRLASTNGAGDAASAGLLSGVLRGVPPEEALAWAVGAAGVVIAGGEPTELTVRRIVAG